MPLFSSCPHLKTLIEESDFTSDHSQLISSYPRLEEIVDGLKWRLARDTKGSHMLRGNIGVIKSIDMKQYGLPSVAIVFEEKKEEIILISIRIV